MNIGSVITFLCLFVYAGAQVTGTDPPVGSCLCMNAGGVNVRDSGCGNVIGTANTNECFVYTGNKVACDLSGVPYEYFEIEFGAGLGWMAGDFMDLSADSLCEPDPPFTPQPGDCSAVSIVTRAEWGARPPAYSISPLAYIPVSKGFAHHTVTPHCFTEADCITQVQGMQNYHMDTNGWPDIGYNFLVGEDGQAYEGRGWNKVGAHTVGYNDIAVAVSTIGDFTNAPPNNAALTAIRNIFDCAVEQGYLTSDYDLHGHRDSACTACPGDQLYAEILTWPEYSTEPLDYYCARQNDEI